MRRRPKTELIPQIRHRQLGPGRSPAFGAGGHCQLLKIEDPPSSYASRDPQRTANRQVPPKLQPPGRLRTHIRIDAGQEELKKGHTAAHGWPVFPSLWPVGRDRKFTWGKLPACQLVGRNKQRAAPEVVLQCRNCALLVPAYRSLEAVDLMGSDPVLKLLAASGKLTPRKKVAPSFRRGDLH